MSENKAAENVLQKQSPPQANSGEQVSESATSQHTASTPSSRFRMAAMGAMRSSQSPSMNGSTTANGSAPNLQAAPPDGPLPPPPSSSQPTLEQKSQNEAASPVSNGSAKSGPLDKSKLIYDIARTKMLTQRTLYRLSTETGYIKLRSKPAGKLAGGAHSSSSIVTGNTAEPNANASHTNGTDASTDGSSTTEAPKAVLGWKEQGEIDSGKKTAPAGEPSIFDALAVYVEMIDHSGMWRNCAGVFGLMFLTYVLTALNFGIVGFGIAAVYGAQWYRNSITRYRRAVKDDIERAYERSTITRTLESVGWLNEFVTRFWLMFEPSLSRMVIDIADPILAQSAPGFVDSLRLTTFTLGTKAPRIDGVRTYSELEDRNQIVMDWHASFTPNDLSDVPPVLRENRVNPKVVLTVRVGKGFIGAGMPILVEDMVFKGKMQVKLQLGPVFPHVRTAE
ncbi:Tricalbin-2, partial [Coemansia brasiliensis]